MNQRCVYEYCCVQIHVYIVVNNDLVGVMNLDAFLLIIHGTIELVGCSLMHHFDR